MWIAFNQKAIEGAFSMIMKSLRRFVESFGIIAHCIVVLKY